MTSTIHRYVVPVDDGWHELLLSGPIVHVAARRVDDVEVWAEVSDGDSERREFTVIGTGHPWPAQRAFWVGTALAPAGLVWHLLERGL